MSLVNSESIRRHQSNNSISKAAFKFSKTQRFKAPNPQCKQSFYRTHTSQLSLRKTSFGYGTKSDFTKDSQNTPAPTNYEIKSVFSKSQDRGKTFGLSRETSPDKMYTIPQMQKVPGPGQYKYNEKTTSPVKYSMRMKPKDFIAEKLSYKQNPGPGAYESIDMDPKSGRFNVSKFGDCKLAKIEPKRPRFQTLQESTLAFCYENKDGLSNSGKYLQSKFKGSGTRGFPISSRKTFIDDISKSPTKKYPGPGNYDKPSQFGVYGTFGDNLWATKRVEKQE